MIHELDNSINQGRRLKTARELTLLSRRAFALKYGINPSSYNAMEDGRYKKGISIKNAQRLVKAFELENLTCSIEWLLHGSGENVKRTIPYEYKQSLQTTSDFIQQAKHFERIKKLNFQLIKAIENNDLITCKELIKKGANLYKLMDLELYMYSRKEDTPLHIAASSAGSLIINFFIELGMHPNSRNRNNETPVHYASYSGNNRALQELFEHKALVDPSKADGSTPLMWASLAGQLDTINLLIEKNASINNTDFRGNTPISCAAFNGQTAAVELLYGLGADISIKNNNNLSPLDYAIQHGHINTTKAILKLL